MIRRLVISFALLLFLAACLSGTGGENSSGEQGKKPPVVDKCAQEPLLAGCQIIKPYLDKVDGKSVANYLIREPNLPIVGPTPFPEDTRLSKKGEAITSNDYDYGTLTDIGKKNIYLPSDFTESTFIVAKGDDYKDNIIHINNNYYYIHKDSKLFTQFLPALNKLEILALDSISDDNVDENNELRPNTNIFRSDQIYKYNSSFNGMQKFANKAKDLTFKGFALVGFSQKNRITRATKKEDELYPGNFTLTFKSDYGVDTTQRGLDDDKYFSMKIILNDKVLGHKSTDTVGIAVKPAVKLFEIKDYQLVANDMYRVNSYEESGVKVIVCCHNYTSKNQYVFSQSNDAITQVAGIMLLKKSGRGYDTFASNEVCKVGVGDCLAVELTD